MRGVEMLLKISNSPRFSTKCLAISKKICSALLGGHMNFFVNTDATHLGRSGLTSLC